MPQCQPCPALMAPRAHLIKKRGRKEAVRGGVRQTGPALLGWALPTLSSVLINA